MPRSIKPQFSTGTVRFFLCYVLPLCLVGGLGAIHLFHPFHGDQALFLLGASVIDKGGVLYVDFWDVKQPGIYFFFLVAGRLFGFSELGVHAFELVYLILFAAVLIYTLRSYFETPWLASLVPLSTVGAYYSVVGTWHLTQLEILVAFPIYLSLWLASAPRRSRRDRVIAFFLSGGFAGIAVLFKLMLAPILAGFWLVSAWVAVLEEGERPSMVFWQRLFPAFGGLVLVLTVVAASFWTHGALAELLWTSFVYPIEAVTTVKRAGAWQLVKSLRWFGIRFAPWLGLACFALVCWRGVARELVTLQLFTWVGVGLLVILAQRLSWWEYHLLLLVVPVGILAIRGLDGLATALANREGSDRSRVSALTVLVVLVALGPGLWFGWMKKAKPVVSLIFSRDRERVPEYQMQVYRQYRQIWWETRFLADADASPGPIYVFGNPLYLLLSGRDQALPIQGWAWEFFLHSQWEALPSQLAAASPPYLYVDSFYEKLIAERSPATEAWIEEVYVPIKTNARGTWYRAATRGRSEERGGTG